MSIELYYTAPADDVFDEIKAAALSLWRSYGAKPHNGLYVAEKVGRIEHITNVADNWMHMVAMFDTGNKLRLFATLRPETVRLIVEALQ